MKTNTAPEDCFRTCIERANRVASHLLSSHLGGYTHEDVVGSLIEKQVRLGKSQDEIVEILRGPMLYRYLQNVKNDLYRSESAVKRGSGDPVASFEEVELFYEPPGDNPETLLVQKEELTLVDKLIADAQLSRTQIEILAYDRQGYSSAEIAEIMGMDVDIVYARRSEAIRKIGRRVRPVAEGHARSSE